MKLYHLYLSLYVVAILAIISCTSSTSESGNTIGLSNNTWYIWLDKEAEWENDSLFLPPVDISQLPTNVPTVGWDALASQQRQSTKVPATVEEYFWGKNGNPFGVSGNYVGVSWFSTKINIPEAWKEKRIVLHFESVRLRAEIYVNKQLAGYDIINGTPFTVDISNFVGPGENSLDVRITDPNGNFAWRDWETYKWGNYDITPSHGFGGITGKVTLEATDRVYIADVFIKNKPELNSVDIETAIEINSKEKVAGQIEYVVKQLPSMETVYKEKKEITDIYDKHTDKQTISLENAKLWSPDNPNLYQLEVNWVGNDNSKHTFTDKFGFRFYEVRMVDGDRQFYLNGKRHVFISAISWGHWPVNGIYPTEELAKKQIMAAKKLGMNMLNFHRGIGQNIVLDAADEIGLLYYAEPGGYGAGQAEFTQAFKREKLLRMVKSFRNHPSLVVYNMINEAMFPLNWAKTQEPFDWEKQDMRDAHKLDETRIITYTSSCYSKNFLGGCPIEAHNMKMCMLPYDHQVYNSIWWDEHHAGGSGVYLDNFYNGPGNIYRHYDIPDQIVILGEEGAVGAPPRLELIQKEYKKTGKLGWDGDQYLAMYNAYENYLNSKGFKEAFSTVDALTQAMGNVSHYHQAKIIENTRIGNTLDGYIINGWENTKVENHSGMVDIYRNLKTESGILAYHNQPLYVAVKCRNKVVEVGDTIVADFFIVNEKEVEGNCQLTIKVKDSNGELLEENHQVQVTGGHTYGELLLENIAVPARANGYIEITATLKQNNEKIATGIEKAYAVDLSTEGLPQIAVLDTSGDVQKIMDIAGIGFEEANNGQRIGNAEVLIVGAGMQPGMVPGQFRQSSPVMDWVSRGNTLIILDGEDVWGEYLSHKEIGDYRGGYKIGTNWFGGNYFVKDHPLFYGLPVNTVFNWEYQFFSAYNKERIGVRFGNGETVVAINADHKQEIFDAVVVLPHGHGNVIFSTLDFHSMLKDKSKANVVAKKLLRNYVAN